MFNKEKFSALLIKIKESYNSQEEFSKASGIGRTYISQYMNCKIDVPPKPKLLEKIANASKGITTYNELMHICGYTDYMVDSFFDGAIAQKENKIPIIEQIEYDNNNNVFISPPVDNKEYISVNFVLENTKEYFAYKSQDDSMLPLLGTGDIAIIEKTNKYESGDTCLIYLDNKDIFIRKIIEFNDYIELHTAFPYSQPIKLSKDEVKKRNFKILGKVIRVENSSAFK